MLEEIKDRFQQLIALYEAQKQRGDELASEIVRLQAANEAYEKQIAELQNKTDNLILSGAFNAAGDSSAESRARLDKLIKEIDKCISLLEKD